MKIALVAGEDPGWGGIGTYTGILGRALGELGHDVRLVLRGWEEPGVERLDGLTVHRVVVPEPSWRQGTAALSERLYTSRESVAFSWGVARVLARMSPDVVEAPEFGAAALLPALVARLKRRGPGIVVRLHAPGFLTARLDRDQIDLDLRVQEGLEAGSARAARLVTAPSQAVAALVARRWRLSARSIPVIANPIDAELFHPVRSDPTPGRIMIVGRVERAKGHDLLLAALPKVRAAVPEAHVVAVGPDGGLLEELRREATRLGVADAIDFPGACERSTLPRLYGEASVCVVPSRFEAFPYSALEAMACGRAVVAARVGGLPEVVSDGESGRLFEPGSPASLAAALIALLRDQAARSRLGGGARRLVLSRYTARKVGAMMVDHYADVTR